MLAAALRRPAHGQAADRPRRRDAARPQARDHRQLVELGHARAPDSASTTRRTSRAGTTSAGSTRTPRSAAGRPSPTRSTTTRWIPTGARRTPPAAKNAVAAARAFWGDPGVRAAPASAGSRPSRPARSPPMPPPVAARPAPERAAPAARRLPRLPDELRPMACHCTDYSPAPRPAAACAASRTASPGARRHGPQPARVSSPARAGSRCRCSAGGWLPSLALEEGIEDAGGPASAGTVSIFPSGGIDSLSVLAPTGDRATRPFDRSSRSPRAARPRTSCSPRTPASNGRPSREAARPPPRGQGLGAAGDRYPVRNQSHFTTRHYWEVGEVNPFGRRLARALHRPPRQRRQPAPGPVARLHARPALATASKPVAAVSAPGELLLGARVVNSPVGPGWSRGLARRAGSRRAIPSWLPGRQTATQTSGCARELSPLRGPTRRATAVLPAENTFGRRMAALAAMLGSRYR